MLENFEQPPQENKNYEDWKKHFGAEAEMTEEAEKVEKKPLSDAEKAAEWQKTFHSGGTIGKEKIEKAITSPQKPEAKAEIKAEAAEVQTAEQNREKTHEEIAKHLVENPVEALAIFKKGIGLKLDRACIDFVNFWEKTGAKALKAVSWPTEKAVGYPLGGIDQAIWAAGEFIEAFPGQKRLDKVLEIHDRLERLGKGELTPEKTSELQRLQEFHKYAAKGQWEEIGKFNKWHEQKKDVLSALRTFGGLREKLSRWAQRKQEKAEEKKEKAKGRRIGEVKEKLK